MTRRVTVGLMDALEARLDDLEQRLTAALADGLHPLATAHRYELAGRLRDVEAQVKALDERCAVLLDGLKQVNAQLGALLADRDGDGETWKRDAA